MNRMTLLQKRALDNERLRISRDIHDNLGARLTEMILLTDLAQRNKSKSDELEAHVNRLSNVAREVVRDLNEIVWAVNPNNDFLDNLGAYIFQYVDKFLGMTSIRCRLDMLADLPHWPLSSEARHSLFLVVKEALNNIVKHSGATEVWVRLQTRNSELIFTIEDNGKGFSTLCLSGFGNGMGNMEKRVLDIGGRFALTSQPGKGTRIEISIPPRQTSSRSNRQRAEAA
jgi:signal transduction histidine kinase